ncbi:MAG: hypothetical protein ACT4PT_12885, partial [Methanobacteriota archaeon]
MFAPVAMSLPEELGGDLALGEPQRWIVGFYRLPEELIQPGATYQGEPVVAFDEELHYAVVLTERPPILEARARLDERVRYVQWDNPTYGFLNLVPNDSRYGDAGHYGSKKIGAEAAWDR